MLSSECSLDALLPPAEAADIIADPRIKDADALFRSTMRGMLVATSFRDLPAEARVHPGVQQRLWAAMDEMDAAVGGVGDALSKLTPEERAEISAALRAEPELGARVLDALDAEAARAGVSLERRAHMRKTGEHACFRMRVSTSGFIDEYSSKVRRSRPMLATEAERYLSAGMGETAFEEDRNWQFAVFEEWQRLLAEQTSQLAATGDPGGGPDSFSADDAYAPPAGMAPPPPPGPFDPESGKKVLKVGAWLFGIGLMAGATGGLLVSSRDGDAVIAGLFSFTAAAVLGLGGLICLLIGAILRMRVRSRQTAAMYDIAGSS